MNFPGAVLLGEENPRPDFYYWPVQTMVPQYTSDYTGDYTGVQATFTYDADAAATVFANTLDYCGAQRPFAYNGGAVPTTVTNTLTGGQVAT